MAFGEELILRTKLQPPRLRRWTLARPRLNAHLEEALDYRVTLLVAPTGYGKSTLLAGWLATAQHPYAWYNLGQLDADPFIFLLHLIYAFRDRFPGLGERALEALEREWREAGNIAERRAASRPALHLFINELCATLTTETVLVLDDFHLLEGTAQAGSPTSTLAVAEEFIAVAPPNLHIIIASRQRPAFELLPRWQVQQELFALDKMALAFTPAETARLFDDRYGYNLNEEQAARLSTETEGWIIALQMVWQNLQSGASGSYKVSSPDSLQLETSLDNILKDLPGNLSGLFDYLAQEVLSHQEAAVQRFLLGTSVLRRMTGPLCDFLLELPAGEGESRLRRLSEAGLFIIVQGDDQHRSYRYHHLFGEFLYSRLQSDPSQLRHLHGRAARYYAKHNQLEDAAHHYLAGQDWEKAAELLEAGQGKRLIDTGRLERLEHWLTTFAPDFLATRPALLLLKGDYLRLTSRFEEALQSYRQAAHRYEETGDKTGLAKAFRSRALVYLDTVQPAAAEEWLEQALEAAEATGDPLLLATLLRDMAENKLNRGRPLEAEELHRQARQLLGEPDNGHPADVRIWLRSGRIHEATGLLERNAEALGLGLVATTTPPVMPANSHMVRRAGRSHREGLLILSLLNTIQGAGERGAILAEQGIFLARELQTPFTEAVAWERLGHALNVQGKFEAAHEAYQKGLALGDKLQVQRLRAEGLMGLCLLYGGVERPEEVQGSKFKAQSSGEVQGSKFKVQSLDQGREVSGVLDSVGNPALNSTYGVESESLNFLAAAQRAGEEGLRVARQAGDEWIEGFLQVSLAAALTRHGEYAEALSVAQTARAVLDNCGDPFGLALARLWGALASGDRDELSAAYQECKQGGYQFVLERPTLFGPKSPELFRKLEEARISSPKFRVQSFESRVNGSGVKAPSVTGVTNSSIKSDPVADVSDADLLHTSSFILHPSFLTVRTLGAFSVQRADGTELGPRDWQRDKARQLFQLLLTRRDKPLPKEQILDYLWPESDPAAADSRFKVTLNALVRALEPERSSRAQSTYIVRTGSGSGLAYALNTGPGLIRLDAAEFEQLANQGAHAELDAAHDPKAGEIALDYYSKALELYKGDFLPGCLYEDWAAPERERLLTLFLSTAERYSRWLAARGEWERCLAVCRLILARDNCWEEAYRLMMLALWKQGHRAAALRTYEKCVATLSEELGVEPVPQTTRLYDEILLD